MTEVEEPMFDATTVPAATALPTIVEPASISSLRWFFALSARSPRLMRAIRPIAVGGVVRFAPQVIANIAANAERIFGRRLDRAEARRFARAVVSNFYETVVDMARAAHVENAEVLRVPIDSVDGLEGYNAIRQQRRGAVLITAHMGRFEIGLANLRQREAHVHVVFKRDSYGAFEAIRSRIHSLLGVHETPIDEGLASMLKLRDALAADHVVVIQADRALPGQRNEVVPVLFGRLRLPLGPVKLARLTNSPIVPVFVVRDARGQSRIHLLPAIEVDDVNVALRSIGEVIGQFIGRYPEQWLVLDRAFDDDAISPGAPRL